MFDVCNLLHTHAKGCIHHMRSATQPYCNTVEYGCVSLRMRFFSQNCGTIKRILPGSSSPSLREGPGIEVDGNFSAHSRTQSLAHTQGSGNSRLSAISD